MFRDFAMNSVSFTRIHYLFGEFTLNSLGLSRSYLESTIIFRTRYLFAKLPWRNYLFRRFTKNLLSSPRFYHLFLEFTRNSLYVSWIHYLFRVYLMTLLSISRIHYESTTFSRIHYLFRESIMNLLGISRSNYKFTVFNANLVWIWCFPNSLWIQLVFSVYTTNSLSITRFTLNSLRISRIYFDFTMKSLGVLRIHYCRFHGKGFLQTQTWKNKIAWFASSCWLSFSFDPDWPVEINKIHDSKYWPIRD